jgi:hypothetical protein
MPNVRAFLLWAVFAAALVLLARGLPHILPGRLTSTYRASAEDLSICSTRPSAFTATMLTRRRRSSFR